MWDSGNVKSGYDGQLKAYFDLYSSSWISILIALVAILLPLFLSSLSSSFPKYFGFFFFSWHNTTLTIVLPVVYYTAFYPLQLLQVPCVKNCNLGLCTPYTCRCMPKSRMRHDYTYPYIYYL